MRLTGGVSADVFKLELKREALTKNVALRIHGDTHGGHDAQLEFDVLQALCNLGVRLPQPLAVDASLEVINYPYLLIDFVEGSTKVAGPFAREAISKMAAMLHEIHGHRKIAITGLPSRIDPLEHLQAYLPDGEEFAHLSAIVSKLETEFVGEPVLLHGDYWPENVIWKNGEIVAVLDWEDSAMGDPISDVACCYVELRYIHGASGADQFLKDYGQVPKNKRLLIWQLHVASAAQKYMGSWGLPADREAHMRATALEVIRESSEALMALTS